MPRLTIDGRAVEVEEGATLLEAARSAGVEIPVLCAWPGIRPPTTCMVCVVRVNGGAKLVPSCATVAREGMEVESETEGVREARRTAVELLLSDHLGDCVGPCQSICPAHMDIPRMIRELGAGDWAGAIRTVKAHIALPAVLGRICPEICEKGCRRGELDSPVSICRLKRYAADRDLASGRPYRPACAEATGRRVAIVGGGPAGLAAAWTLRQQGHGCVILDREDEAGGALRRVPGGRLPLEVVDAEIAVILGLGITLKPGIGLGDGLTVQGLRANYDAVLLAMGEMNEEAAGRLRLAWQGKGLAVDPGTLMTGVDGVFAAGSAVTPSRHAVRAVASGRQAAFAIGRYLRGETPAIPGRPYTVHIGKLRESERERVRGEGSVEGRVEASGGEAAGLSEDEVRRETARCLHCDCLKVSSCALRTMGEKLGARTSAFGGERREYRKDTGHPNLVFEPGKCTDCGRCVAIAEKAGEKIGLTFEGRGFSMRLVAPFSEPMKTALARSARECADACPTAALAWVDTLPAAE